MSILKGWSRGGLKPPRHKGFPAGTRGGPTSREGIHPMPPLGETAARESISPLPFRLWQTNAVSTVPAGNPPRQGYRFGSYAML